MIRVKSLVLLITAFFVISGVNAQKKKKAATRPAKSRTTSSGGYGASTGYGGTSGYGGGTTGTATKAKGAGDGSKGTASQASSGYGAASGYGGGATQSGPKQVNTSLPITVVKGNGGGFGDSTLPSLRNDNAFERQLVKDRTPLDYENIREDDAVYKQRVWREIDAREKINLPFLYSAKEDNGDQHFISILYNAIQAGDITVFNPDDDRFTTPLTKDEVAKTVMGGMDTVETYDMNGEVNGYQVRSKNIEVDSIYRFRIKEEWIFDKESSRMFVRILGIAPVMKITTSNGMDMGDKVLFWAYYPDLRPTLAKFEVYNGRNYGGRMSWEELFESRFFSSRIIKSSLDNPKDLSLATYIKDPLFRLLEGEKIKEKIFNYEQDLWSY